MISAAGSFMTELKMPLTQIEEIFTKSELTIMAWTSQEQSADLEKTKRKSIRQRRKSPEDLLSEDLTGEEIETEEIEYERPRNIPSHFYNDEGEVDLSKVTGKEAVRYMAQRGIHFLPIFKM